MASKIKLDVGVNERLKIRIPKEIRVSGCHVLMNAVSSTLSVLSSPNTTLFRKIPLCHIFHVLHLSVPASSGATCRDCVSGTLSDNSMETYGGEIQIERRRCDLEQSLFSGLFERMIDFYSVIFFKLSLSTSTKLFFGITNDQRALQRQTFNVSSLSRELCGLFMI